MNHANQSKALADACKNFADESGESVLVSMETAAQSFLYWLDVLQKYSLTGHADELLHATCAAVRESAGLASIGLIRPCLFSMRAQIDLLLGWLYFKDHAVEYGVVQRTGDGFKLKKELLKYLTDSFPGYGERLGVLSQCVNRRELDPYRLLSAHIHAQSSHVVPKIDALSDIVRPHAAILECAQIQFDVSEFLVDILFSMRIVGYKSLPAELMGVLEARKLTPAQIQVLIA